MQVGIVCVGPNTKGMCFKIQKTLDSLIAVHKIQPNSPFAAFD